MTATPDAGLCGRCTHARHVRSGRGSEFMLCGRSLHDPSFPKYPSLPVVECRGYAASACSRAPGPQTAPLTRIPLWQAALFVVIGGAGAQLVGAFVSGLLRAWLVARGHSAAALQVSAVIIVPAMFASACSLIAVACSAPAIMGLPLRSALSLRRAPLLCFVAAALGTVMLGPTADALMRAMQSQWPQLDLGVVPMLNRLVRSIPWLLAWPAFALLPGISEELLFRGLLQTAAGRSRYAIAISALSFSFFHIDPQHIAGVLPIGFFLAWVAARSGTLVTICAHVANNTAAIAAVHSSTFDVGYGTSSPMPPSWLPLSLVLVATSIFVIVRNTGPNTGSIRYSDPTSL
jgi:membrane protease YdiL (CAAX protease family)